MKVSIVQESSMRASLQISDIKHHNFVKRLVELQCISPDYKLCIDILKMCIF